MDELRHRYTTCPAVRPFIQEAVAQIKRQASRYDDTQTAFFAQGLDVDRWIDHPGETPDAGYLLSSPLSHPLIYLCQIANFISILHEGIEPERLIRHTHSATGFSTGVVAAVLVSMGLPIDELCRLALQVQAMFFWQGIRCQQSMLRQGVRPTLAAGLLYSAEGSPSCMASIERLASGRLDEVIASFSDREAVHKAYGMRPDWWVVSGMPEALLRFREFLRPRAGETAWRYIPSTIPAHSPLLSYAFRSSPLDAQRIGLRFRKEDMKMPVWSTDGGMDLSTSENVLTDAMRGYLTRPGIWWDQIRPVLEPGCITHVLDFGPGAGTASLTQSHLAGSGIQVLRCSATLGRRRLLEEVAPLLR
jgi:malonyl CoA-acyl carrier protein transacylase